MLRCSILSPTPQRILGRTGGIRRGSAMALMVVVSVVITGLIISIAWSEGLQASAGSDRTKTDEAFYAADGAIQYALGQFKAAPGWPSANLPKTIIVNNWNVALSYTDLGASIGMATGVLGNPLKFTAKATKSGTSVSVTASAKTTGVLAYAPQFYNAGNLTVSQSAHINGDVQTMGTLTINAPSSGSVQPHGAKGQWKSKGAITDNNPTGTPSYFASTPVASASITAPSMSATSVFNTIMAGPYISFWNVLTINPVDGNYMIDFSLAGGKPVYFSGAASYIGNVDIKSSSTPASDTLIIDGDVNFSGTYPANAATATMNLIIHGNSTVTGTGSQGIAITGSSYVTGNWSQSGIYSINGSVMADQNTTLSGTGTVGVATLPSFDPRYQPKITAYYGALP